MDEDDFIELTPEDIFLTVLETETAKNEVSCITFSKRCIDYLQGENIFVKIFGNSKTIKLLLVKTKTHDSFKIAISKKGSLSILKASNIVKQLKNIGWTFSDGRKFAGVPTNEGINFYKEKPLKLFGQK